MESIFKPANWIYLFIMIMLITGIATIILLYSFDLVDNIYYYSIYYLHLVILNRALLRINTRSAKFKKYVVLTELLFLIYILFMFAFGYKYFLTYRLLNISAFILMIFQFRYARPLNMAEGISN